MDRYSKIFEKRPREIVLLRGSGCVYKRCAFCDYHLDMCDDESKNFKLNSEVLSHVTGEFNELEVINSGSVFELDAATLALIKYMCSEKQIHTLHFEAHYLFRDRIDGLRQYFDGINLKIKLGLETFDHNLRENVLHKGINETDPKIISKHFDEANFLFGITGQSVESMKKDVELGLENFERICVNIMCENSTSVKPDRRVIADFIRDVYPIYKDDNRVDILINNTDFGVGD